MVTNRDLVKILSDIGEYLEMDNVPFKPRAYAKVAQTISEMQDEVAELYKASGRDALKAIPGVGDSIADHIEELLKTGKLKYYNELKRKAPVDVSTLTSVEGVGPKKIRALYEKLGIKNLEMLEEAARAGKIAKLEGFGKKSEENILKGIEFVRSGGGRFLLGQAWPIAHRIEQLLKKVRGVERVDVVGSLRRRKETIGDIDILAVSNTPEPIMEAFITMPEVVRVYAKGETKSMVRLKDGLDADLRVIPKESYGAALNYFTGSKDHNIALRKIAIEKGWKLNEYGLYRVSGKKEVPIAGKTEEELYEKLGLEYIQPELREMMGEIEAAHAHKLPKLIDYTDLKGDLQTQTNWTDGSHSIEEMAMAAMNVGLEYIAITDHTKRLAMTHGLDAQRLQQQIKEIDRLNLTLKTKNFRILKGTECDILKDGSLDLPDDILKQLDVVGVSVHSHFTLPRAEQMARVVKAMRNPHADILFHPTGRLINKRPAIDVDVSELISVAKETGMVLEIDSLPDRLDLRDEYIKQAIRAGVKLSIDSDAHTTGQFEVLSFGIAQARRGWAESKDIINTHSVEQMLSLLK